MKIEIPIPIYDSLILLVVDEDINTLKQFSQSAANVDIGDVDIDIEKCGSGGMTLSTGNMIWCIYIPSTKELSDFNLIRVFSHEICHVVLELIKCVGVNDDEAFCYLQDWLLGKIIVDYFQCTGKLKSIIPNEILRLTCPKTKKSKKKSKCNVK